MNFVDEKGKKVTIASPPLERVEYYLVSSGGKSLDNLTFEQRKKVFLLSIKDFLDGTLCLDEMSGIALKLWKYPTELNGMEEDELNDAVYACSELNFYVRKIEDADSPSQFDIFMNQVMHFYKKNSK